MWQSGRTTAKENSFYNKIATCVLTNVDVNYTPNGEVQSFGDGAPTQIAMSLSFKETEMMTKQHVERRILMAYSEKVLDHYNNPRNVGKMDA